MGSERLRYIPSYFRQKEEKGELARKSANVESYGASVQAIKDETEELSGSELS